MNYKEPNEHFRQDEYLFVRWSIADLFLVIDIDNNAAVLFGDVVLYGRDEISIHEQAAQTGDDKVIPLASLAATVKGRINILSPYRKSTALLDGVVTGLLVAFAWSFCNALIPCCCYEPAVNKQQKK